MGNDARRRLLIGITGMIVMLGLGVWRVWQKGAGRKGEVRARIVSVDPAKRRITVEYSPKEGRVLVLKGQVPPECRIRVGAARGDFSDLQAGQTIEAVGEVHRDRSIVVGILTVVEPGPSTTAPAPAAATHPAGDPVGPPRSR